MSILAQPTQKRIRLTGNLHMVIVENFMINLKAWFLILLFHNLCFGQNLQWAKSMGGSASEYGKSIALDALGNVYTTGYFQGSADFDPGSGTFTLSESGNNDIFISKLDPSGNFVWAKRIGGMFLEEGVSIIVDASDNILVTGKYFGTVDFDPGSGLTNLTSSGNSDIFVLKLDAAGSFIWAKSIGGNSDDESRGISTDASNNIYITGRFQSSSDFDPGAGTFSLTSNGNWDIFILKLNALGNFIWAKAMGSASIDGGTSIKLDGLGNIYTSGSFQGTVDFDPGAGISNLTATGSGAAFISKLDINGNFIWAKNIGGNFSSYALSIEVDSPGNVFTTGFFQGTTDFDPGATTYTIATIGYNDVFVSKLDASGNFVWAKNFGGSTSDAFGNSIAVDATGNVYTFGYFDGTIDFDPGVGISNFSSPLDDEIFISKLDASGNFVWAKRMGGSQNDYGHAMVIDAANTIYTTGSFGGIGDFDPDAGTFNLTSLGIADIFINKFGSPVGLQENAILYSTSLYPNPNNGSFKIKVAQEIECCELILVNSLGQTVYDQKIFQGINEINVESLSSGFYSYLVTLDAQKIADGKLLIE